MEREHRRAIGVESKVMERTCTGTKKKMEKRRDKPPKTCRGNEIKARESKAESAMYWWGKKAERRTCRYKKRN